jgi:hypothetical protein
VFLNRALHHTARLGIGGPVDIGLVVTLLYSSNGALVSLRSGRIPVGRLEAASVLDSQTVRGTIRVLYGAQAPDPDTRFVGRVLMFSRIPGVGDVPLRPAA